MRDTAITIQGRREFAHVIYEHSGVSVKTSALRIPDYAGVRHDTAVTLVQQYPGGALHVTFVWYSSSL